MSSHFYANNSFVSLCKYSAKTNVHIWNLYEVKVIYISLAVTYINNNNWDWNRTHARYLPLLWPVQQSGAAIEHNDVILTNLKTSYWLNHTPWCYGITLYLVSLLYSRPALENKWMCKLHVQTLKCLNILRKMYLCGSQSVFLFEKHLLSTIDLSPFWQIPNNFCCL